MSPPARSAEPPGPGGPPRWIEPMAATLAREGEAPTGDWLVERKLDGVRVLAHVAGGEVRLLSRNRIVQDAVYPEVVDALAELVALDAVVDGEVVAFDGEVTSFERLQQRMHVHDEARSRRSEVRVTYIAFDLPWLAGRDLRGLPLRDRRALLGRVLDLDPDGPPPTGDGPVVQLSDLLGGEPADLLDRACTEGWEGLIAKRAASTYQGRRSRDWLKLKCVRAQEVVVVGFTEPAGSRTELGALLVGYHEGGALRYGGKVGTGFSRSVLRSLRAALEPLEVAAPPVVDPPAERGAHWVRPELVAQVGFGDWSRAGRLRHARYLGLRADKDPAEVVREHPATP